VPLIAESGGGSVVFIASQFGHVAVAKSPAYCAAKAGLINLAKAMAIDHAAQKVRVNSLSLVRWGRPACWGAGRILTLQMPVSGRRICSAASASPRRSALPPLSCCPPTLPS